MKRLLSLLLASVTILSVTVGTSAENTGMPEDIKPDDWYYEAVNYVYERGIMYGTAPDAFAPDISMTRAMFAAVIYRMAGCKRHGSF